MIANGGAEARATAEEECAGATATAFCRVLRALPTLFIAIVVVIAAHTIAHPAYADGAAETLERSDAAGSAPLSIALPDATLTLPIPPGYCAVARDAPDLAASFAAVETAFGKATCLLAWFVDCETLASVRDGALPVASLFAGYGVYVTPINGDGMVQRFTGMTRAAFVRQIAASLPRFDRALLSITVGKSQPVGGDEIGLRLATREIGLLGSDAQAYYLATAVELTQGGERRALAGVAATTLLHEVAVSTIVYGELEGAGTLAMLEQQARAATLALVEANPGGDSSGRGFSLDTNRLLLIGFAIGLVFIAIGLVNLAWKYWCRRYGLQP